MRLPYEEKSYEDYFNTELDRACNMYFPIGQVQEGSLGFDSSAHSRNRHLWKLLGFPLRTLPHFEGVLFRVIAEEMEHYLGYVMRQIPTMKVNLLFQFKRPEFITMASGKEWEHWGKPYYRYKVYTEQQELLMHLHNAFTNQVLILYAAPAIYDIDELLKAKRNNEIIKSSNICKASELDGHYVNTYTNESTSSLAFSEPEQLKKINLISEIEQIQTSGEFEDNRQFVTRFSKRVEGLMYENKYYADSFAYMQQNISVLQEFPLVYSFATMSNFNILTGIQWSIAYI